MFERHQEILKLDICTHFIDGVDTDDVNLLVSAAERRHEYILAGRGLDEDKLIINMPYITVLHRVELRPKRHRHDLECVVGSPVVRDFIPSPSIVRPFQMHTPPLAIARADAKVAEKLALDAARRSGAPPGARALDT